MEWDKKPILEKWEIMVTTEGKADENTRVRIRGNVHGDDTYVEGQTIITGKVEYLDTRSMTLKTRRGKMYRLGALDPDYKALMISHGIALSDIKVRDCFFINRLDMN